MRQTILAVTLASMALGANADMTREEWTKEHFKAQGSPYPDGGVQIVPMRKLAHYSSKQHEQVKSLGYIKEASDYVPFLMHIKEAAKKSFAAETEKMPEGSTEMRKEPEDMPMAYPYVPVPRAIMNEYFGVAPYLTYLPKQGWVGLVEFFNVKDVGNCSYKENNIKLSHGSVAIAEEDVSYVVNGKATTVDVMGTPESGFVYNVEWYEPSFFHQLECANMRYDASLKDKVVNLAVSIDSAKG